MTALSAIQIKLLFTLSEMSLLETSKDPAMLQVMRLLNDSSLTTLDTTDPLFIDAISQLCYLKILTPERTERVLQGLRPA